MTRRIWVFGGTSPLGSELVSGLEQDAEVICFGRSEPEHGPNRVRVDFSDEQSLRHTLRVNYVERPPSGIVFAQRYRPEKEVSTLDSVAAGLKVELGPLFAVVDLLKEYGNTGLLRSIVMYSSTAANSAHLDVPIFYHLLKSATLSSVISLSPNLGGFNVKINALILGDFLKYSIESYSDKEKLNFQNIAEISMGRRCGSIADIVGVTRYLLSDEANYVTGQVIQVDGGASLISPASYIRAFSL